MYKRVWILNVDKTKILEADLYKLDKNKTYFLTYENAVCYLLFSKLEDNLENYFIGEGLERNINKLEKIIEEIKEVEKKYEPKSN